MPVCIECHEDKRNGGGDFWGGSFVCMDCAARLVSHQVIDLLAAASTRCTEPARSQIQRLIPRIRTGAARIIGESHDALRARTHIQIQEGAATYDITIRDALVQFRRVENEPSMGYSMEGRTGEMQRNPELPPEVPEPPPEVPAQDPPVGTVGMWNGTSWLPVANQANPVGQNYRWSAEAADDLRAFHGLDATPSTATYWAQPPKEPEPPEPEPIPRGERLKKRSID